MDFNYIGELKPPENILASRYASPEIVANFSDEERVFLERGLWIEIMRKQADLGVDIPASIIQDYCSVQADIDVVSIREREKISHHDVNARIEEFNSLAGHQKIQLGMTSRDVTENIEQLQIAKGLDILTDRLVATLCRFGVKALLYNQLPMAGRTHNVAAQTITLGKRFANFGEEVIGGYDRLIALKSSYKLRGLKGPVGTQQDMLNLFEGDEAKVAQLEQHIAEVLGFSETLENVGQIYPRSMDFDVVTALKQVTTGPVNFATTLRLMAGHEFATEGFKKGQVGSNAMPHKMNAYKSERITSLSVILSGHVTMVGEVAARQWNEGDVSCSAARRVFIPDSFYAADGIFLSTMAVLDGFGVYPAVIDRDLQRYLLFFMTTKALMAAVKAGVGRETAHEVIKEHAVAAALAMREKGSTDNDLLDRLANDPRLRISNDTLGNAVTSPLLVSGLAVSQVAKFVDKVESIAAKHPHVTNYVPPAVL